MAVVFSWKVAPGKYAYLIPENGSYLRSRVTDPDTLHMMATEVDTWDEETYVSAFDNMKSEIVQVYGEAVIPEDGHHYYTIGTISGGKVVLLSGKDGSGKGGGGTGDEGEGEYDPFMDEDDYRELERKIREEFDKYKNEILAQVEQIRNHIETSASQNVGDALNQLSETRDMLAALRRQMEEAAATAQNALDAARSLSEMPDSEITPELLESILGMKQEVGEWMDRFDGKIQKIITDYDKATQDLGLIGYGADPSKGMFSFMAENINTLNSTVGTAGTEWDASHGSVTDIGTWFDESNNTYAEAMRQLNASLAEISDVVSFVDGSNTTRVGQKLNAMIGEAITELDHTGGDGNTTHIEQKLNALSASVETNIYRYDATEGRVVSLKDSMDGLEEKVTRALTAANMASGTAKDIRDEWDTEKGIIQSVSELIVKKDGEGHPIYWYTGPDGTEHIRVYIMPSEEGQLPKYNTSLDETGTEYTQYVLPDYMSTMLSYIAQNSDAIDFAVSSGDVISALKLTVTEDGESIIYGLADKVLLDSHVIASSLTATAANIGGVHIGAGMISAQTGDNKWALRGDGVLEATGAAISGHIFATSLTLADGARPDVDGMVTIDHWVGEEDGETGFMVSSEGLLQAKNAIIQGTVAASDILLNGKSLKLFGDGESQTNTFSIGDNEIKVEHVPMTYDIFGIYDMDITDRVFSGSSRSPVFEATGSTDIYLPVISPIKFTMTRNLNGGTQYQSSFIIVYAVFSGNNESDAYYRFNNFVDDVNWSTNNNDAIFINRAITSVTLDTNYEVTAGTLTLSVSLNSQNSGQQQRLKCIDGRYYVAGYKYLLTADNGDYSCQLVIPDVSFINAPNPVDRQFFNIGKNGMQIFLGGGFYFTAANDSVLGPIIAMGGLANNSMVGLKIDSRGMKYLNGDGKGWKDFQ